MSAQASPLTQPHGAAREGAARGPLGRRLHVVGRLARKGLDIACGLWREATGREPGDGVAMLMEWLAFAHAKVARALRMAVLLRARLIAEIKKAQTGDAVAAPDAKRPPRLYRLDRLLDNLLAGLIPPDRLRRYVMTRPVDELILEIARDLGLTPDWLRQIEAEWAREQRSGPSGSPLPETGAVRGGGDDSRSASETPGRVGPDRPIPSPSPPGHGRPGVSPGFALVDARCRRPAPLRSALLNGSAPPRAAAGERSPIVWRGCRS